MVAAVIGRPKPDPELLERFYEPFAPSLDAEAWIRATFIESDGPLFNEDHEHLQQATIGVLWTATPQMKRMRQVVGQAEIPTFQGNKWTKGRQEQQMRQWFAEIPDFVITFDAHYALSCTDREFCALVEHELYHCGQELNEFGIAKAKKDGRPSFAMRGHDVEEFIGVVRRYGPSLDVRSLVEAAGKVPAIDRVQIDGACGTCRLIL